MSSGAPVAFRVLLDAEQHAASRAHAAGRNLALELSLPRRPSRWSAFHAAAAWIAERVADGLDDIVVPEHIPIVAPARFSVVPEPVVLVHPPHVCQVPDCADDCA